MADEVPIEQTVRSPDRRGARRSHAATGLIVWTVLAALIAIPIDREVADTFEGRARASARAAATPYADALRRTLTREISLLSALRSFVESRESRDVLLKEFRTFVDGARTGNIVRVLQLVQHGRIVLLEPLPGNERALGLDLTRHPHPVARADYFRVMESGRVIITGPLPLVQGGLGLLVRHRLPSRPGFPELGAVIIDVDSLVAQVGLQQRARGYRIVLVDREERWIGGDPAGSVEHPERLAIATEDGAFHVLVAPAGGWNTALRPWKLATRAILVVLILSAGLVGWLVGRRRDRLERAAKHSATALELVLRAGRMGGWEEVVPTGHIHWSPAITRILGRSANELGSRFDGLLDLVDAEGRERLTRAVDSARRGNSEGFVEEVRVRGVADDVRWLLVIAEVKRDASGAVASVVGVVSDATEHHALEERLQHAQRLAGLGRLARSVGADFGRLLDAVNAAGARAQARLPELPSRIAQDVQAELVEMLDAARRGTHLTRQLLVFAQRTPTATLPIDISDTVRELLPTLSRLLPSETQIELELGAGLPRTSLDAGQFEQVLVNLVVNARDAMPEGGRITVQTLAVGAFGPERPIDAPPGDWVVLRVEDRGIGMSAATRERIFEPYFTTKPLGRGTGLGLAVVYGIVEGGGGATIVRSSLGSGTVFDVYLPASREHDA